MEKTDGSSKGLGGEWKEGLRTRVRRKSFMAEKLVFVFSMLTLPDLQVG